MISSKFQLNIYHSTLDMSVVVESPATTVNGVLNNVGGALGLCLGMSLLVFVEIVEFLIRIVAALFAPSCWASKTKR